MFERNRQFCGTHGIVAAEAQERTAEQKQRDIYETHRHRIFSVSYYMTANEVEAESIMTETFVEAFRVAEEPDAGCVDRALLAELESRFPLAAEAPACPEDAVNLRGGAVRKTEMEEAVGTLPARERLVFLLRDVEGYGLSKVALLLRCEEREVAATLVSARIRMRNSLGRLRARRIEVAESQAFDEASSVA